MTRFFIWIRFFFTRTDTDAYKYFGICNNNVVVCTCSCTNRKRSRIFLNEFCQNFGRWWNSYLGTQLGGVRSTSHAANNFMGTGLLVPDAFSVFRSIFFHLTSNQHNNYNNYNTYYDNKLMKPTINNNIDNCCFCCRSSRKISTETLVTPQYNLFIFFFSLRFHM